ncbi:MAG: hypothetical protein JXR66_04000 [Bacteroidales bacterium]|nr:hypothetical protein [Bacteroidales bacterium]MBN2632695.1 hypothetical protein [Bacteroidales bacterium]
MASVSVDSEPKLFVSLRPSDLIVERTFPVFVDLLNIRLWSMTGVFSSDFGSLDEQTRRSE